MKTCICGRTEIMWNTYRVGVTADNTVNRAFSLTVVRYSLVKHLTLNKSDIKV